MLRFFRRKPVSELQRLVDEAKAGNRQSHENLKSGIFSGLYTLAGGDINVGGDVKDSIVITGGNNNFVKIKSGKYQGIEELVQASSLRLLKSELAERISISNEESGTSIFTKNDLSRAYHDVVKWIADAAVSGSQKASDALYEAHKTTSPVHLIEFMKSRLAAGKCELDFLKVFADLSWFVGDRTSLEKVVTVGSEKFPEDVDLAIAQASVFEHHGKSMEAFNSLNAKKIPLELTDSQQAENQVVIRKFLWHLYSTDCRLLNIRKAKASELAENELQEALIICDRHSHDASNLTNKKIDFLRMAKQDLGFLSRLQDNNGRDAIFSDGEKALSAGDASAAKHLFYEALKIDRLAKSIGDELECLTKIADTYRELGDFPMAIETMNEALSAYESSGCAPGLRGALMRMADIQLQASLMDKSHIGIVATHYNDFMNRAEHLSREMGDPEGASIIAAERERTNKTGVLTNLWLLAQSPEYLREMLANDREHELFPLFELLNFSVSDPDVGDFEMAKWFVEEANRVDPLTALRRLTSRVLRKELLAEISGSGFMQVGPDTAQEVYETCGFSDDPEDVDEEAVKVVFTELSEQTGDPFAWRPKRIVNQSIENQETIKGLRDFVFDFVSTHEKKDDPAVGSLVSQAGFDINDPDFVILLRVQENLGDQMSRIHFMVQLGEACGIDLSELDE